MFVAATAEPAIASAATCSTAELIMRERVVLTEGVELKLILMLFVETANHSSPNYISGEVGPTWAAANYDFRFLTNGIPFTAHDWLIAG